MNEAKERIKEVLKYFTDKYLEFYKIGLINHVKSEILKKPPKGYLLLEPEPDTSDIIADWVVKEGAVRKSWKRRYCIMRHDFRIDYYPSIPSEGKKVKPKGTMYPCGYSVIEKPTEKPERKYCICLHHDRRRSWYLDFDDEGTRKQWIKVLRNAVENSEAPINPDPVSRHAFRHAFRWTRWHCHCYSFYKVDADEGTMLGELVTFVVVRDCDRALFGQLPASGRKRVLARAAVDKTLAKTVNTTVAAAWKGCRTAVESLREAIEGPLRTSMEPLVKLEDSLHAQIDEKCRDRLMPLVEEHVVPPLANVLGAVTGDIFSGFESFLGEWSSRTTQLVASVKSVNTEDSLKSNCLSAMAHFRWAYWGGLRDPCRHLDNFRRPLQDFPFDHFRPWQFVREGYGLMRQLARKAYHTLEILTLQAVAQGSDLQTALDAAVEETRSRLLHDAKLCLTEYIHSGLMMIVWTPLARVALPVLQCLTQPLDATIPGPMKQFIVLGDLLERFVKGVVGETCQRAVEECTSTRIDAMELVQ